MSDAVLGDLVSPHAQSVRNRQAAEHFECFFNNYLEIPYPLEIITVQEICRTFHHHTSRNDDHKTDAYKEHAAGHNRQCFSNVECDGR